MPETKIGSAEASDLKTAFGPGTENYYSVSPATTDGATGNGETYWNNRNWSDWLGYFNEIPELHVAINTKATFTIGKGFTSDEITEMLLDSIKGNGKDTFNTILENMIRTYHIAGDAYAEIIRDKEGILINLKPLDPGSMKHVANDKGVLIRFEQESKIKGGKTRRFKPEDIFYLPRNRIADEIHGTSLVPVLVNIINARNEAMDDWRRMLHRNIDGLWIYHLDTDDPTEIAKFKADNDAARGKGESMYIPKGVVVPELVTTASNATLNPMTWIDNLNKYFWQATGGMDIFVGGTTTLTDASGKIKYLSAQQTIEEEQLFIEEQVLSQLNLEINLEFPASLESDTLSDKPKEEEEAGVNAPEEEIENQAAEPNDKKVEMEGRK